MSAIATHMNEANRLAELEGWRRPKKNGVMTFGELEEGQFFLHMDGDGPIPITNGYGIQSKYHNATTMGENRKVNYCISYGTVGPNNVSWEWAEDDLVVYGLNVVEEYE